MNIHRCHCAFIPPHVQENLARAGVEGAAVSAQVSRIPRKNRANRVKDAEEFMSLAPVGTSSREVYDSQNEWRQRVKMAREEGDSTTDDKDANNAYDYAGMVRDYYKEVLKRNSIDNANMNLILNVHYGENFNNAFWDGDEMTFGDGDGRKFVSLSRSLDVVGHELAHGVTQWEANLIYEGQCGALNEHFSDVFGSAITQYAEGQTAETADWLIGDEIMGPELRGEALRSMKDPGSAYNNRIMGKDPQPAHMRDYYTGSADNHGVHINSGILNKAFYLAAMEVGTDMAALIWYAALQKLWPTANFNDAVLIISESARLLAIDGKAPADSPQKIRAAFKEVGLPT
ncbi:M4 family metallopeptidase [Methylobacter sp. YRD-M1]|uniref:M4 family metallopeptidase n=1 Tax=Methylobacter sp. YRD-M1 TaxID=2911520 RepID=UPI00227C9411|nr:M4 family metallopeptidase [Methylobacter sp. YRD-M1]WAK00482.1 M4 family metallopeptidase [Methylobacter sp. YRD-M1]